MLPCQYERCIASAHDNADPIARCDSHDCQIGGILCLSALRQTPVDSIAPVRPCVIVTTELHL